MWLESPPSSIMPWQILLSLVVCACVPCAPIESSSQYPNIVATDGLRSSLQALGPVLQTQMAQMQVESTWAASHPMNLNQIDELAGTAMSTAGAALKEAT